MKRYIRKIVVDNQNYTWCTGRNNCDGDGSNLITIWKDKKQIHHKLINGNIQITPSLVRKIIDEYNASTLCVRLIFSC
jgi:hypothetical protein